MADAVDWLASAALILWVAFAAALGIAIVHVKIKRRRRL